MPITSSIIWAVLHMLVAIGLNMVAFWFGLIKYAEVFSLYFVILAFKQYYSQVKFTEAYKENPELVEDIMREQYLGKED